MKSFVLYTRDSTGLTAFIDFDATGYQYGRLFYSYDEQSYSLIINGITGITPGGFIINIPSSVVAGVPVVFFYVEMSADNVAYQVVADGVVKVIPASPGGSGIVSGSVSVDNFPAVYPLSDVQYNALISELQTIASNTMGGASGGLTDTQLRAAPVPVSGTVNVGNFPTTQNISGTISLDATTLAALETITVLVQSGQVIGLDAATLAALESITVSGTVALDAGTLAALETINAVVSGTVALDAPTLAALETITATVSGTVNVGNLPSTYPLPSSQVTALAPQTNAVTDTELRASPLSVVATATDLDIRNLNLLLDSVTQTLRPSLAYSSPITGPVTNQVLVSVGPTQRIRLIRNAGHIDPAATSVYPNITLKIGGTTVFMDKMEPGLPWSETVCFEGALGDDLTITIDAAVATYLNMRYELF